MPTYGTATTTVAPATAAPYSTFHTVATRRAFIREMGFFTTTATTSQIGVIAASNTPVATTSTTPQPYDAADATATCALDTAWSTAPTVGANYFRQTTLGPAIGAGVIWKLALDERLILAKSTYYVFWNFGTGTAAALSMYLEYDE